MNETIFFAIGVLMYAINVALCVSNCRSVDQRVQWAWTLSLSLLWLPMLIIIGTKIEAFLRRNGW